MTHCTVDVHKDAIITGWYDFCRSVNSLYTRALLNSSLRMGPLRALKFEGPPDARLSPDASSYALDWQAYNYIRKFSDLPGSTPQSRREAALSSWSAAELACFHTNERLKRLHSGDCTFLGDPIGLSPSGSIITPAAVIIAAQRKIESCLGPFNKKKALSGCRWSNGATMDLRRGTPLSKKMTNVISVTPYALPILRWVLRRDIHWSASVVGCEPVGPMSLLGDCFDIQRSNRFLTVPKNAYTDRSIGAECTGNAFLQQGVGIYIRSRLKRCGIDLKSNLRSQELAQCAFNLSLATIDLESASDTISFQLVKLLLPQSWFDFLCKLRSTHTLKDGQHIKLEKFSSMGCAFTFELESLIFWALTSSINDAMSFGNLPIAIFGDDIVISQGAAPALIGILRFLGFKTNLQKTFLDGPFYESCGKHYFLGEDVTPCYQVNPVKGLDEVIRYHNRLRRWSARVTGGMFSKHIKQLLKDLQKGPFVMPFCWEGDPAFIAGSSELTDVRFCPNRGYLITTLVRRFPLEQEDDESAVYAYKLRRPGFLNVSPLGYAGNTGLRGKLIRQNAWISRDAFVKLN